MSNKFYVRRKNDIVLERSNLTFKSQKDLKQYLYNLAERVKNIILEPESKNPSLAFDYKVVYDLFERHPEKLTSVDENDLKFLICDEPHRPSDKRSPPLTTCEKVRAYYYDNGWKNFSLFRKCISNKEYSKKCLINEAFRRSIQYQIDAYKIRNQGSCNNCGNLSNDIDQIIPFKTIVKDFLDQHNLILEEIEIEKGSDERVLIKDPIIFDSWKEFHSTCELQSLCKHCHLEKTLAESLTCPPKMKIKVDKSSHYPQDMLEKLKSINTFGFTQVGKVL
jgi:5-methylcytosine-specific restriction endonuclease McrA